MGKGTQTASWLGDRSGAIDLRRSIDDRTAETVVNRAGWLEEPERAMVLAVFRDGLSAAEVARIRGEEPRLVRRSVSKAAARLLEPIAAYVAARAEDWPTPRARVARSIYHHGRSMRETARVQGLSLYTVRTHRDAIEGVYEMERAQAGRTNAKGVDRRWR